MLDVLLFIGGLLAGGIAAGLAVHYRARSVAARESAELNGRIAADKGVLDEVRKTLAERDGEIRDVRGRLQSEQEARVTAATRLTESEKNIEQQRKLLADAELKLKDAFTALSTDALRHNSEAFVKQAAEKVKPLTDALKRYEDEIKLIEKSRQTSYAGLTEQLKQVATTHLRLSQETTSLTHALRTPQVKGRWGELQLRRAVEAAGLSSQCDYVEQFSVGTDDGKQRPDLLVRLPGDRTIVVDSKVSTNAYLDALGAEEGEQGAHLARYVKNVREHVRSLSNKAYWSQFENTPDFVVMFVPGESFFSAALEQDRTLIEDAMNNRVILASPTTLIALLRTVAYSWRQQELLENARLIGETAQTLFERVCIFAEHLGKVGQQLHRATSTYNAAAASWQTRVLPMGSKVKELGVKAKQAEFTDLKQIDVIPRLTDGA